MYVYVYINYTYIHTHIYIHYLSNKTKFDVSSEGPSSIVAVYTCFYSRVTIKTLVFLLYENKRRHNTT